MRLVLAVLAIDPVFDHVMDLSSKVVTIDLAVKNKLVIEDGHRQLAAIVLERFFLSVHLFGHPLSRYILLSFSDCDRAFHRVCSC